MKIQFFSINLICLFTALNLNPVAANAEPIGRPLPKPIAPKPPAPPPALPKVKPPAPPEVGAPRPKPLIEDRKSELEIKKSSDHSTKPSTFRPATEVATDANKAKLTIDPEVKALMDREKIAVESDAMKGLLTEHAAFDASLTQFVRKEPNHLTSQAFETNLAKRLVGEEMFEQKGQTKESGEQLGEAAKNMKDILCARGKDGKGGCGHSKFGLSCRRITAFLAAASTATLSVPIGKAFYDFLQAKPDKEEKTIEVPGVVEGGKSLIVKDIGKKIDEEDPLTPARESK